MTDIPVTEVPERYNVSTIIDDNLEAGRGGKVAIYCGDQRITYAELLDRTCRMGRALRALGVGREDRVLLTLDDTPEFPVSFFGAIRIGAIPVPVNPLYKVADFRYFIQDSYARVVVTGSAYLDKVQQALEGCRDAVTVVAADGAHERFPTLEKLLASEGGDLEAEETHRDDVAFWLYSSGSTGKPKGVVHLQHDIPFTCAAYARHVLRVSMEDVVFSRPLFHAYGLGNSLSFPFSVGASTVLRPGRPTPQGILETIQRYRPSLLFSVPTMYNAILNYPDAANYDLSSIRLCISAAEPLPPETWRRWHESFGLVILDGVGSTEMLHIYCSSTEDDLRPGSSGKAVPGYRLRILDESGGQVSPGEVGDLYVAGDSAAPYYWHQHERSKQTMQGEWFKTGDRYRVDGEGFYWYMGRADDMIKVRGEWISPIEIENTLLEHGAVHEAAVVGVPTQGLTAIHAWIVLRDRHYPSATLVRELQDWCKSRLQRYQYPDQIHFVPELPKTLTGKIERFRLRETPGNPST
jgi:benzoate-CoA ligase